MHRPVVRKYILIIYASMILSLVINKLCIRPWLQARNVSDVIIVISNSLPNFLEAVIGSLFLATVLSLLPLVSFFKRKIRDSTIYSLACLLAAIYVISQELKWHNLGGTNVYDPYDLVASIIGLVVSYFILMKYGIFLKKGSSNK